VSPSRVHKDVVLISTLQVYNLIAQSDGARNIEIVRDSKEATAAGKREWLRHESHRSVNDGFPSWDFRLGNQGLQGSQLETR